VAKVGRHLPEQLFVYTISHPLLRTFLTFDDPQPAQFLYVLVYGFCIKGGGIKSLLAKAIAVLGYHPQYKNAYRQGNSPCKLGYLGIYLAKMYM
jgi:hypothetical protein